ncbi:MAG: SDR family oxidoreductase [Cytophagales bacterium]|nr:SDR family oxidoreductase [Cytophagales bacterium]
MIDLSLAGKRAIVCGSTQGIGWATAQLMALQGAELILIARDEDKLKECVAKLYKSHNQLHSYICADFRQADILKNQLHEYVDYNRDIHILVNNTGGPIAGPAIFANVEDYVAAFNQHVVCNQILVQEVVPLMKRAGYGRIINIISTSVKQPIQGLGVSNTIRAAVANWAKTLSIELAPNGITVNNILPGYTETTRIQSLISYKAHEAGVTEAEMRANMENEVPVKRFASPSEIAYAALFLATPMAAYINGVNLAVDGGKTSSL